MNRILIATCLVLAPALMLGSSRAVPEHSPSRTTANDAPHLESMGKTSMKFPTTGSWTDITFEYLTHDHADGIHDLFNIAPVDPKSNIKPYQFLATNESLLAAYPRYFQSLGNLLCTEWAWGAGSCELIVFRLDEHGQLAIAFRGTSRFGYDILNLSGGPVSDICEGTGFIGGPIQMKVYSWNGSSFAFANTIPVHDPGRYAIVSGAPRP